MRSVLRHLKLYFTFLGYSLKQLMVYRTDFFTWSAVTLGWVVFTFIFYGLLFNQVNTIGGWTKGQVFVLQGFHFVLDFFLWGVLYANFNDLPARINRGQIDLELTKPVNAQFLLSFKKFSTNNLNNLVIGIITIVYGLKLMGTTPSLTNSMYALTLFGVALVFVYAGYFTTICFAFWTQRLNNIVYLFPQIRHFAKLPLSAYTGILRFAFTYIIPITLIAALPSQFLFNQPNWELVPILIFFSTISLYLSHWFFEFSLKKYSSASS